jgi:hypothetical protein
MSQKNRAPQTAPNADVRVSMRLKNGSKTLREIVLPSGYAPFADIVAAATQVSARKNTPVVEVLKGRQVDEIIDIVYTEAKASERIKSVTVQAALEELKHALCGMRLYKLRAVGGRNRTGSTDNAKIEWVAYLPYS